MTDFGGGIKMTEVNFFVYGSMSEGLVHFNRIKEFVVRSIAARAQGMAYRLKVGFPVMLQNGQDWIPGHLLKIRAPDILISLLDQFHGFRSDDESKSLYFRREIEILTESGLEKAFCYVLNPSKLPKNATKIPNGDWISSLQGEPTLLERLTERQKHYIEKLGKVVGREIVPINDLNLYRELMNLELIVDKGRRLALSKLGNEVFRYLG
jgi:gamma-glutamylcyclotransferase (GGCT)/AIG2-like uncharacterized protein YtfP